MMGTRRLKVTEFLVVSVMSRIMSCRTGWVSILEGRIARGAGVDVAHARKPGEEGAVG